jgi:hypothetical protein
MAVGRLFSLQPRLPKTAQNSPELHFCFINFSIQPSLLKTLVLNMTFDSFLLRMFSFFVAQKQTIFETTMRFC